MPDRSPTSGYQHLVKLLRRYRTPLFLILLGIAASLFAFRWVSQVQQAELKAQFDHSVAHEAYAVDFATDYLGAMSQLLLDALQQSPQLDAGSVTALVSTLRTESNLASFQWWYENELRHKEGTQALDIGLELARDLLTQSKPSPQNYLHTDPTSKRSILGLVRFHPTDDSHLFLTEFDLTGLLEGILKPEKESFIGGLLVYSSSRLTEPVYQYNPDAFAAHLVQDADSQNTLQYDQLLLDNDTATNSLTSFEDSGFVYVFAPQAEYLERADNSIAYLTLAFALLLTGVVGYLSYSAVMENFRVSELIERRTKQLSTSNQQLKSSEEKNELVMESAGVGIWEHDVITNEFFLSRRLRSMLAIDSDDHSLTFKSLLSLIHEDYRADFIRILDELKENRSTGRMECKVFRHSGGHFWAQLTTNAKWNEAGELERVVGSVYDSTESRTMQQELIRSNEELDNFAYIASHDLKEPLRGMSNHTKFLEEDYAELLDEEGKQRIERIQFLAKRMEKLISDLLYFSRLGREEEKPETTDLNLLVQEVCELYADENTVVDIVDDLPVVKKDRQRLSDLFRNLIGNAVKYNTKETKQIVIGLLPPVAGEPEPTFYIEDNGIGIDKRFYVDIFKIFKRLHRTEDYGGGTGSGLTFSKKIVEEWGGKIWLLSELGEGTTFYFTLGSQTQDRSADTTAVTPATDATHHHAELE